MERVRIESIERRFTQQLLIESAVADRYSEELQESRDELLLRHYGCVMVHLKALDREMEVVAESVALFVRMWLSVTPRIPEEERQGALREAEERYGRFVKSLTARLNSGSSILTELPAEILDRDGDVRTRRS